jgi:Holliday junction resolvasome RuvABC endonuclease subunit
MTIQTPSEATTVGVPASAGQPPPRVIGLDLSLTGTGVASNLGWADVITPGARRGHPRLHHLRAEIVDRCKNATLVVVEGPAYGAKGDAYHQLAGLWWLITHALWDRDTPTAIVPPANLKRYATGRGVAGKDDIMREVSRRFPWFGGGNNAADALVLAAMGAEHLGHPMVAMPQAHRAALAGVVWPEMATVDGAGVTG